MKNNTIAYVLIGIGVLALLARMGGSSGWFWVGLVAAALLAAYNRTKSYGLLIPACILTGIAVGLLLEVSLRMHGALLISIGVGFLAIDRVEPRKSRWPVVVGGIVAVLGFLIGLAEIGAIGSLWLALILIGGGIYMLRQRLENTTKSKVDKPDVSKHAVEVEQSAEATVDEADLAAELDAAQPVAASEEKTETVSIETDHIDESDSLESTGTPVTAEIEEVVEIELDEALYEQLTVWRKDTAKEEDRAAYLILTNSSLDQIARDKPTTLKALRNIKGIGPVKLERYGEAILAIINADINVEEQVAES